MTRPRRFDIEGESLTVRQITARLGKVSDDAVRSRLYRGERTWAELRAPNRSPWRRFDAKSPWFSGKKYRIAREQRNENP